MASKNRDKKAGKGEGWIKRPGDAHVSPNPKGNGPENGGVHGELSTPGRATPSSGEYEIVGPRGGLVTPLAFDSSHNFVMLGSPKDIPVTHHRPDVATPKDATAPPRPHTGYDAERAAYARFKPGLLETSPGRFVALVGEEVIGPFEDFRSAYVAGRRHFGPGPLYIKQVLAEEPAFEPVALEPCLS